MPRVSSLTGLRWWAAFVVFLYHMAVFAPIPLEPVLRYGHYGVTFFFVLSGFVLTWSWSPTVGATTFWWRRFARIYPSHIVALALAVPVFYSFAPDPAQWWVKPVDVGVLLLSVLLLQGWSRDPAVLFSGNPAAWTLTCEAFFYAMHPPIQRVLARWGRRGALVLAAGTAALALTYRLLALTWPTQWWAALPWPITRLTEFVLGMALAWAFRKAWRPRVAASVGYLAVAAVVGAVVLGVRHPEVPGVRLLLGSANELVMLACAVAIVAVAARDLRGGRSLLRKRWLVTLGEWSYTFYLVHATIIYVLLAQFGRQALSWNNLWWYAAAFVVALAASALMHRLVERPAERRMRGWWDARLAAREERAAAPAPVASPER
ncbi:acyltransferase [Oerskovia sp. Sa1BUA8]|uniref:Acyltransferase n=2 Tax=Oerskovia douganii TaxID=2762210 RepID=A0A9D5YY40_9CELL|nr:acyltransferase [Oerskovia douganii]